jgi:hypothetical protein
MLRRWGLLVILVITLAVLISATAANNEIGSSNSPGIKIATKIGTKIGRPINAVDQGDSSNQQQSYYFEQPRYSMSIQTIPNQERPYIIILNKNVSQSSAADGTFQVVSQPLQYNPNTITDETYWFGIYGPYKSWLMNISKEDFVEDNVYGIYYLLNLTKADLMWSENGTELAIRFIPKDTSIDISDFSFSVGSSNNMIGIVRFGWRENTGFKPLPKEGDLSEINYSHSNADLGFNPAKYWSIPSNTSISKALILLQSNYSLDKIHAVIPEKIGKYNSPQIAGVNYTFNFNKIAVPPEGNKLIIVIGEANDPMHSKNGRAVYAFNVELNSEGKPEGVIDPFGYGSYILKAGFEQLGLVPLYVIEGENVYEIDKPETMTEDTSFDKSKMRFIGVVNR